MEWSRLCSSGPQVRKLKRPKPVDLARICLGSPLMTGKKPKGNSVAFSAIIANEAGNVTSHQCDGMWLVSIFKLNICLLILNFALQF